MPLKNYGLVTSLDELATLTTMLIDAGIPYGFDIETGYRGPDKEKWALHPETAHIAGISFTNSTDWARYAPLGHDCAGNLDNRAAARLLWQLLRTGLGVAHNIGFELRHLAKFFRDLLSDDPDHGADVTAAHGYFPVRSDTMVEAYLIADYPQFGLKPLTERLFGHKMTELHELFPSLAKNRRKHLRFNVLPLDPKVVEYACEDSVWCLAIHQHYYSRVRTRGLYTVEMAISTQVVPAMEDVGVRYDWARMRTAATDLRIFRDRFNAEIMRDLAGLVGRPVGINLASPPAISKLLYDTLGFTTTVYTATTRHLPKDQRKMSTGKIALQRLAKQHPVVERIRQWKEITRLLGTYLDKYEDAYGYAPDGNTHPNHLSAYIPTGRFAVGDPPYQQSPRMYHFDLAEAVAIHLRHAEEHGKNCACDAPEFIPPQGTCFRHNFRDNIVAPAGWYILGFDLSQAELRAIAGEAQETALLKAFEAGEDVHTLTAALIFGIPIEQVTKVQRSVGKTLGFALLYGMGVKSLADRLGVPQEEAQRLYDTYFTVYAGIAAWTKKQVIQGTTFGFVTDRFGRHMPIWAFKSDNEKTRQMGERQCVNYPIQAGATGSYVKGAMVRAMIALRKAGLTDTVKLVMNIHDALEFYVHGSIDPTELIAVLQPAVIYPVPGWPAMKADWHAGKRWGSPKELTVMPDGRLLVADGRIVDVPATLEHDDDEDEEVLVLPDEDYVSPEEVSAAVATLADPVRRTVTVTLQAMPDPDAWARFTRLMTDLPGHHRVRLDTPDGQLDLDLDTALGPEHLAEASVILGPVSIHFAPSQVDTQSLLQGLTL
jgi:DNA polymerase-1